MYSGWVKISECALCVQTVWQEGREGMVVASVFVPALDDPRYMCRDG